MRAFILFITLLLSTCLTSKAQDPQLAQQYFLSGEYEKAATLYEILYNKSNNDYYFGRYIESLIYIEDFAKAENTIKKQIKSNPDNLNLYVTYGNVFEKQLEEDKANEQYEKAIKRLPSKKFMIIKLANAFQQLQKYDLAIKTFEKGSKILKDKNVFAFNLGDLYRKKGDNTPLMIEQYLNSLDFAPNRINGLKTIFQRTLSEDEYLELQGQLYERIQEDSDKVHYSELLVWTFIQNKDYKSALRQVKAIDRQRKERGNRIFNLAKIAANDKDYDTAIEAYDYIVNEKGQSSTYYVQAKREGLSVRRDKIIQTNDYSQQDLTDLENAYNSFLDEFGRRTVTATIISELASLQAFYLKDLDKAIALLSEVINYPQLDPHIQAEAKLDLADLYLIKGDIWESTLLYSQVDKAFKDDILGHEARYKNAKLSYYNSDFEWAQTQFNVLKASTSKLIANDALDLSIFIMDNLGIDTNIVALGYYADADLLIFQNRFDDAFLKLDTLENFYPEHSLTDDIYYAKAKIYLKQRNYDKAVSALQYIVDNHFEEIRADNALFELANLYETQLEDKEKAKQLYEKLFLDLSASTFAVEARKRYRLLRGDEI